MQRRLSMSGLRDLGPSHPSQPKQIVSEIWLIARSRIEGLISHDNTIAGEIFNIYENPKGSSMTNHLKTHLYLEEIIVIKDQYLHIWFLLILLDMQPQRLATTWTPYNQAPKAWLRVGKLLLSFLSCSFFALIPTPSSDICEPFFLFKIATSENLP